MLTVTKIVFKVKTLLTNFVLTLLAVNISYSQVDTSKYFPLKIGNYWEYWSSGSEIIPWFIWVTGDTLMDNGKQYFMLKNVYDYSDGGYNYYRLDSLNNLYQYIIRPDCIEKDELLYNFVAEDSSMWPICGNINPMGPYFYGIFQTTINYYPIFNSSLRSKWFTSVLIDTTVSPPDTLWDPIYGSIGVRKIAKGVGMVESIAELGPHFFLTGAIIDSNVYGTISEVKLQNNYLSSNSRNEINIDIYPNPFNSRAKIKISISESGISCLEIYNLLGEKVETISSNYLANGEHYFYFEADNIPSGVYLAILKSESEIAVKKLILIR
jgi:hypothetical protein